MFNKERLKVQQFMQDELVKMNRPRLEVTQTLHTLSFTIIVGGNHFIIGWEEFVNQVNRYETSGIPKEEVFESITVNGTTLNEEGCSEFWNQYNQRVNHG